MGPNNDGVVAVKASLVIDATGSPPLENGVVVVRGRRIEAIGPIASTPLPEGCEVVELHGHTLMPGLIDTHGHLSLRYGAKGASGVSGLLDQQLAPGAQQMLYMVRNARISLLCGVTTMRMTSEGTPDNPVDSYLKGGVLEGLVPGPRIIDGGTGLTPTAGHGNPLIWTDGCEAVRARVRKDFYRGAEWIKILLIDTGPDTTIYSTAEIEAIVDEAHRWGLRVTVHCTGRWGSSIVAAIRAGVDNIEHARPMTPEIIAMLVDHKVGVSLTPLVYVGFRPDHTTWDFVDNIACSAADWVNYGKKQYFDYRAAHPEVEAEDRPYEDGEPNRAGRDFFPSNATQQGQALAALKAGVKISLGLDTVYYGCVGNAAEYLIEGGFTPMEGIRAATAVAAENIGYGDRLGTLECGKLADLISLTSNPLKERWAWDRIAFIMKDGIRYDGLSWR